MRDDVRRAASGDRRARRQLERAFAADGSVRSGVLDALAAAAAGGDNGALEVLLGLIDEHRLDRPALRRILVSDHDMADAHQEVLMTVAVRIGSFRSDAAFGSWLFAVGRNTAIGLLRRRRALERLGTEWEAPALSAHLSSLVADRADVAAAIDQLPAHYREVVLLREMTRATYAEIAEQLGIELGTVQSRLARGRALLAQIVDRQTGGALSGSTDSGTSGAG